MASEEQVRQYLAHWFQLGKKVLIDNGQQALLPEPVFRGDRYSQEFEDCWRRIISPLAGESHLEGTHETIAELLTSEWEIILCSRCVMPIPLPTRGLPPECCPCFDLPLWPNTDVPKPRSAVNTKSHLRDICDRLEETNAREASLNPTPNSEIAFTPIPLDIPVCQCPSNIPQAPNLTTAASSAD